MTINEIQSRIIKSAGYTYRSLSPIFNLPEATSTMKLGRGLVKIKDLVELCEKCNAKMVIYTQDGDTIEVKSENL